MTLATTREQEYAGYLHLENAFAALEMLKGLYSAMPVHTIFGERKDML